MVASASREEIIGLLKQLEDIAKAEQFQTPLQNFCKENCQAFNAGENSLECTDIHAKYTRQVEALLLDSFAPEELDILTEGVEILIHDTATVKIKGETIHLCELEGDLSCLTFLLLCKDFEVFKREMLDIKGGMQQADGPDVVAQPGHADGTSNIVRISKLLESKDGWKMLKDTPDHSYGYRAIGGGKMAWRCSIGFDATPDDLAGTVFYSMVNENTACVPMFEKATCLEHVVEGNTESVKVALEVATTGLAITLMSFIMGSRVLTMRQKLHKHSRGQGGHILEMATDGSKVQNQVLFLDHHPTDPKRCLVIITEEWSPFVPNFLIRAKYDKALPGILKSSTELYKKNSTRLVIDELDLLVSCAVMETQFRSIFVILMSHI